MLGSRKDFKFPTTLTKTSLPMLSSLEKQTRPSTDTALEGARHPAASYQKDICFVTSSEHKYRSTRKTIKLRLPPPLVNPAKTVKDIETSDQQGEQNAQCLRVLHRSKVKLSWHHQFTLQWFTAYRILIALTVVINALILGLLLALDLPLGSVLTATATNLFVSVLVRQEDLINLSFGHIARIPSTLPLSIRKLIADFHHYGGVHIGCAVSALLWYCLFVVLVTHQCIINLRNGIMTGWHWTDITTCYVFLLFVLIICLTAIPFFRTKFHNHFECTHRFGGWASLVVLWINSGIHTITTPMPATPLEKNPALWLLAATTFLIVLPWLRIRQVPITAQQISAREVKLTFPYAHMPYTSTSRFSSTPLAEWHAFATMPCATGSSATILVSAAGDWTKRLIAMPPTKLWIRRPATSTFLAFTSVFNSVLLVATGAGIGPLLSLLTSPCIEQMQREGKKVRVLWCVYEPHANHWAFVQSVIHSVDPRPAIIDSKQGRPDLAFEARYLAHIDDLEAVMVVSNKKVTQEVVAEIKMHGRAAYGAVFDS